MLKFEGEDTSLTESVIGKSLLSHSLAKHLRNFLIGIA